ncbi:XapX domain-containing protein [Alteribacillus iranensis]|uniref:XapX domain-containing protein n=1 Tax=Alteribacillus iranensis TaxID=930128 RepID=A0A1I2C1E1_9BACI|nr:XapX domain-containing protein [Alteribacillus iranensis]SFE62139.1 XapX domain-containing protein [Alteribacillus iranensis]
MQETLLSLVTGVIVGLLFAVVRLPIPAPPALPGIMGIIGIFLGYKIYEWILPFFQGGGS